MGGGGGLSIARQVAAGRIDFFFNRFRFSESVDNAKTVDRRIIASALLFGR